MIDNWQYYIDFTMQTDSVSTSEKKQIQAGIEKLNEYESEFGLDEYSLDG